MVIFPAIDIIEGKVVRLCNGDYGKKSSYKLTPLQAAQNFCEQGATHLHVVDLDGAKSGNADNATVIENIVKTCGIFVEVGGGIRSFDTIKKYLDCGVKRVILGTVAVTDFNFVEKAVEKFGDLIAVGVDAKDNKVAIKGWTEITQIDSLEFCQKLKNIGIHNVIYTDISKDGMLNGTNLKIYEVLCQTKYPQITASGGIKDIKELKKLKVMGAYGAILGKVLYENAINLKQAISLCED